VRRTPVLRVGNPFHSICAAVVLFLGLVTITPQSAGAAGSTTTSQATGSFSPSPFRTLDGSGNNLSHPLWGATNTPYLRIGPRTVAQPTVPVRYVSNRVFNDLGQNLFSERGLSQFAWVWGQFMDHTFGLAQGGTQEADLPFNGSDPLERFRDDFGTIPFTPDARVQGQNINTVSSYIDAFNVYGGTNARLDWLRNGKVDGDPTDNAATLMLPGGYLPRADARGDASTAPDMAVDGALRGAPSTRREAGDVRANENMALTAMQTLFAREHNRIVDAINATPRGAQLSDETKFQLARRVVGAEEQYITYNEFLPAMGVQLPQFRGYNPNVNASLSNEFATVGYRAHSQVHGEFELNDPNLTASAVTGLQAQGVQVAGSTVTVPLGVAFFNPDLVNTLGLGPVLAGFAGERQYKNDEQMDESLRSVLFQVPGTAADPSTCFEFSPTPLPPDCFVGVEDLGAIDVARGRDHQLPSYNAMRQAYGLPPVTSFKQITGENTESMQGMSINDPHIMDFVRLFDRNGNSLPLGDQEDAVRGVRRTTLAARLKAVYGSVDNLDAFVGMQSEQHVAGTEFGPLQLAMWRTQFTALRDGDRYFYGNDPLLASIKAFYGVDYRTTLAGLISRNTGTSVTGNVFFAPLS
jgi:hypothetical protein